MTSKNQVITSGCRLNFYESEVIKKALNQSGVKDIIVFNTCAVTKEAERQSKQAIRKAIREHPDKKIVVTGCAAQINPQKYSEINGVFKVIGNEEKLIATSYSSPEKLIVNDIMSVKETALHMIDGYEEKSRAFLQVQNGCNHRCTFCAIPYGRGNSRSVPIGEIVKQTRKLVENGYQEVVLTGVDISDYGLDLPGTPSLGQMMKRLLANVPDLPRLRLSSIDVAEIDRDIMDLLADNERFMPYFHISLQAGDDMILKRMKRRHLRKDALYFCRLARRLRPETAFGADMIAGFPTETEEMFQNSYNLIAEAELQYLHIFPYSERDGTPAARMPLVAKHIRKERAAKLREAGSKQLSLFLNKQIGKPLKVLIEKGNQGKAENFANVKLCSSKSYSNQIISVIPDKVEGEVLIGSIAEQLGSGLSYTC